MKSARITTILTLTILVATPMATGLAQSYPYIYFLISTPPQDLSKGESVEFTLSVLSQEGFEGKVQLSAEDVPEGVTVEFNPNPVEVPAYQQGDTKITVTASSSATVGSAALNIYGKSLEKYDLEAGRDYVTEAIIISINIVAGEAEQPPVEQQPAEQPPAEEAPSTVTTTKTITTTVTQSIVSTETTSVTTIVSTETTLGPPTDPTLANAALILTALAAIAIVVGAVTAISRRSGNE
jgi:hypothetical protein